MGKNMDKKVVIGIAAVVVIIVLILVFSGGDKVSAPTNEGGEEKSEGTNASQEGTISLSECKKANGRTVSAYAGRDCLDTEENLGRILDYSVNKICCVKK